MKKMWLRSLIVPTMALLVIFCPLHEASAKDDQEITIEPEDELPTILEESQVLPPTEKQPTTSTFQLLQQAINADQVKTKIDNQNENSEPEGENVGVETIDEERLSAPLRVRSDEELNKLLGDSTVPAINSDEVTQIEGPGGQISAVEGTANKNMNPPNPTYELPTENFVMIKPLNCGVVKVPHNFTATGPNDPDYNHRTYWAKRVCKVDLPKGTKPIAIWAVRVDPFFINPLTDFEGNGDYFKLEVDSIEEGFEVVKSCEGHLKSTRTIEPFSCDPNLPKENNAKIFYVTIDTKYEVQPAQFIEPNGSLKKASLEMSDGLRPISRFLLVEYDY